MAITFSEVVRAAVSQRTDATGEVSFECPAGKSLVIETTPSGEEIDSIETPVGKHRVYTLTVTYVETDV